MYPCPVRIAPPNRDREVGAVCARSLDIGRAPQYLLPAMIFAARNHHHHRHPHEAGR
jgi:hypothetical protein